MEKFIFKNEWNTDIELKKLSKLNANYFFDFHNLQDKKEKLSLNKVELIILKEDDNNITEPSKEQLKCVYWIQENEEKILESIYSSLYNRIYKYYASKWNLQISNQDYFLRIQNLQELDKVFGIYSILIDRFVKDDISYYTIYFKFYTDEEHGIAIRFHKARIIDFESISDLDIEKTIKDMGLNYEEWLENYLNNK